MNLAGLNPDILDEIVSNALEEDRGRGDLTTETTVNPSLMAQGEFLAKEDLVLAGWPVVAHTFELISGRIEVQANFKEGDFVRKGKNLGTARGPARALLTGERVALNFLQLLSGIATLTRRYLEAIEGTKTQILDTRKTTPGLRYLEKYAVRAGGGKNHRFGLYDGVLIKDNHIVAAGGIRPAVTLARQGVDHLKKVEIEVKNLVELEEALAVGAEVILLDNMTVEQVRQCVATTRGRALLEVSGGIGLQTVRDYASTGVDFISVGALTHSATSVDISMNLRLL